MSAKRTQHPIVAGDTYVCVSSKGRGLPVVVERVTPNNVQFRAYGKRREQRHSLAVDAFRVRYALLDSALDRQRALAAAERNGTGPVVDGDPCPVEEAVAAVLDGAGGSPAGETDAPADPATGLMERPAAPWKPGMRKIGPEQAREIWQLIRRGEPQREVASAYGLGQTRVSDIWSGRAWAEATADLRAGLEAGRAAAPSAQPAAPADVDGAAASAPAAALATDEEQEEEEDDTTMDTFDRERARDGAAPGGTTAAPDDARLLAELADALDLLLAFSGRPLPRFVDRAGLVELAAAARARAGVSA